MASPGPSPSGKGGQIGDAKALQPGQVIDQGGPAHGQAEQPAHTGQDGQQEPPQPQGVAKVLGGLGVPRHPGDGNGDEDRRGHDMGLYRGVAHHQAAQNGYSGPDRARKTEASLLNDLKGQQHN